MRVLGVKITGRQGDDSDFVEFELSDVNYINLYKPSKSSESVPVYHTSDGSYAPLLKLKDISIALKNYGFVNFDQSTIVNRNRVKRTVKRKEGLNVTFVDFSVIVVSARSRFNKGN
ncbi:LytTR family transcriptional regulator DNA-binding domain-containing protein [Paenibacillus woosongensis]|uniref:HTH LytTR-type domain-containing protein n=1 Tax=Paenibacillus woosongensis TaxID=307580 RepID=A0ABQ4MRR1_9BACL|nr:hypothetical protein J15TS10_24960 [Paenibacillus woosongensis]